MVPPELHAAVGQLSPRVWTPPLQPFSGCSSPMARRTSSPRGKCRDAFSTSTHARSYLSMKNPVHAPFYEEHARFNGELAALRPAEGRHHSAVGASHRRTDWYRCPGNLRGCRSGIKPVERPASPRIGQSLRKRCANRIRPLIRLLDVICHIEHSGERGEKPMSSTIAFFHGRGRMECVKRRVCFERSIIISAFSQALGSSWSRGRHSFAIPRFDRPPSRRYGFLFIDIICSTLRAHGALLGHRHAIARWRAAHEVRVEEIRVLRAKVMSHSVAISQ